MTPDIDALIAKRAALDSSIREVEKEMAKAASSIFLTHLQQGEWKVENMRLRPANRAAEDALVNLLSDALRLGYHESFRIFDGKISIQGYVDDGNLTIHLYVNSHAPVEEVQEEVKSIRVNVDLVPELLSKLKSALWKAEAEAKQANERVTAIKQAIDKLKA